MGRGNRKILSIKTAFLSLALLGILGIIAAYLFYLYSFKGKASLKVNITPKGPRLEKIYYTQTYKDRKEWELKADSADYDQEGNLVVFKNMEVTFFGKGDDKIYLKAEQGYFHIDTKDLEAKGNVKALHSLGYQFITDYLTYNSADKKIFTDRKVSIISPKIEVEGEGMTADLQGKNFSLGGKVRTILKGMEGKKR